MSDYDKQLQSYQVLGRLDAKKHDDLIGRRIIQGLGFTTSNKMVYELEKRVIGETQGELPLWLRAQRLFLVGLRHNPDWNYLTNRWRTETGVVRCLDEAVVLLEIAEDYEEHSEDVPLVYTRILNEETAFAVTLWLADELKLLKPPYKVFPTKVNTKWRAVAQNIREFVAQFGPYEFTPEMFE
jgi:hypothetical protein